MDCKDLLEPHFKKGGIASNTRRSDAVALLSADRQFAATA